MKRIANPIDTDELCKYGCGQVAKFVNGSKNLMCCERHSSCPANKKKNSVGIRAAHVDGRIPGWNDLKILGKENRGWSKGLTKDTDTRVMNNSAANIGGTKIGHPMSEENKKLASDRRILQILTGKYDISGRKGHRGYFDNIYFHSSWELAYYVYEKEVKNNILQKNSQFTIEYTYLENVHKYVPDFIDHMGSLIEIKGYLFGERDAEKYRQTKNQVVYLFGKDIIAHVEYCKNTYGKEFWKNLYG